MNILFSLFLTIILMGIRAALLNKSYDHKIKIFVKNASFNVGKDIL